MSRSPLPSPGVQRSGTSPPSRPRRRGGPPAPSLSRLNTLVVCSLLLPLVLWLFSSSPNGHSNGGNLAREVRKDARIVEGWVDDKIIHRHPSTHKQGAARSTAVGRDTQPSSQETDEDVYEEDETEVRAPSVGRRRPTPKAPAALRKLGRAAKRKAERAVARYTDEDDEDEEDSELDDEESATHPLSPYLPYLLAPLRLLWYLLTTLLSLLYYLLLPVILPLHAVFVLPTKVAYALGRALMPVGVFLGSCAVVGGLVGRGAAGVVRGWVWLMEGGGEKMGTRRDEGREGGRGRKGKEKERERGRREGVA